MLAKNAVEVITCAHKSSPKNQTVLINLFRKSVFTDLLKYLVHQKLQLQLRLISHPM